MAIIKEQIALLDGFVNAFEATGTLFPSSAWAARELSKPVLDIRGPKNILEAGAGTGPVTLQIMKDMHPGDTFTICELNPKLAEILKINIEKDENYQRLKSNIKIFIGPVQELSEDTPFDVIVCALPFLNFPISLTREIFAKFYKMSTSNTHITWYEYIGLRKINKVVARPEKKKKLRDFEIFWKELSGKAPIKKKRVWLNMLPINVYRTKLCVPKKTNNFVAEKQQGYFASNAS